MRPERGQDRSLRWRGRIGRVRVSLFDERAMQLRRLVSLAIAVATLMTAGGAGAVTIQAGNLLDEIEDLRDPTFDKNSGLYVGPTLTEQADFRALAESLYAGDLLTADAQAAALDYEVVQFTDTVSSQVFLGLRERTQFSAPVMAPSPSQALLILDAALQNQGFTSYGFNQQPAAGTDNLQLNDGVDGTTGPLSPPSEERRTTRVSSRATTASSSSMWSLSSAFALMPSIGSWRRGCWSAPSTRPTPSLRFLTHRLSPWRLRPS